MSGMKSVFCAGTMLVWLGLTAVEAQISHVTVRTPKSPLPPGLTVQTNPPAATVPGQAPAPLPASGRVAVYPLRKPSLDKAELEQRVVAFQKKRALEGSPSAQFELGMRYLRGEGVGKSLAKARRWLAAAAKAGNSDAQRKLLELDQAAQR